MNQELLIFTKAVSDPTRLRILNYLKVECCVGELWERLDLSQNLVSHHLKVLKEAGLIDSQKQGLKVVYCLNQKNLSLRLEQLARYIGKTL